MTNKFHVSRGTAKVAAAVLTHGPITVFDVAMLTDLSEGWVRAQLEWLATHRLVDVVDAWPHVYRWEPTRPSLVTVRGLLRQTEAAVAIGPCEGVQRLADDLKARMP